MNLNSPDFYMDSKAKYENQRTGNQTETDTGAEHENSRPATPPYDKWEMTIMIRFICHILMSFFCICILTGCHAAFLKGFQGSFVPEPLRTDLLADGLHEGFWHTDEIEVHFRYQRAGEHLHIAGTVQFTGHLQNYDSTDSFHLHGWFLDAKGQVLGGKGLLSMGKGQKILFRPFKNEMMLPEGTVSMSFSYSGRANISGSDKSGQDFWDFQMLPFRDPNL